MSGGPRVIDGLLHAPYFVLLKPDAPMGVSDFLGALGLSHLEPVDPEAPPWEHVFIAREQGWLQLGDDWSYHFWHRPDRAAALRRCAGLGEVFAFRLRDVDQSLELEHWVAGERVRHLEVDSPAYTDRIVIADEGAPLPGEPDLRHVADDVRIGFAVATAMGIQLAARPEQFEAWGVVGSTAPSMGLEGAITNITVGVPPPWQED